LASKGGLPDMVGEVHALIGKKYTLLILRALKTDGPLGFRRMDVNIVGPNGSTRSTRSTLSDLIKVGWADQEGPRGKYFITPRGSEALAYAERGEARFSEVRDEEVRE